MSKQSNIEYLVSEIENIGFSVNNTLEFYDTVQIAREMHKEEIKNAQMDMFLHLNNLPYGSDYLNKMQEAENFADEYYTKTFGGEQ
jgi:hypothetical protein